MLGKVYIVYKCVCGGNRQQIAELWYERVGSVQEVDKERGGGMQIVLSFISLWWN